MKKLQPHEFWYYFGPCTPYPIQIKKGTLPRKPYEKFNTKRACQKYIDTINNQRKII